MLKLEEFRPRAINKKIFIEYHNNKDLEQVVKEMGYVSVASWELEVSKELIENCKGHQEGTAGVVLIDIWENAGILLQKLPFIEKACPHIPDLMVDLKSHNFIRDRETTKKFLEEYQTVLEDLISGYRKILKERAKEL